MARNVILMRHGESAANARGVWQGTGSSPLTAKGLRQARRAGERLAGRRLALVESSDLERCVDTARAVGFEPRRRPIWREGDVGEWEGLDRRCVMAHFGEELERLHYDYDMPVGVTGESPRQAGERGWQGVHDVVGRLDEGQTALVVTHAGLIGALLRLVLGLPSDRRRLGVVSNTSFCELSFGTDGAVMRRFNDAAHLAPVPAWPEQMRLAGGVVVELIRHGASYANAARGGRRGRDSLHPRGRAQTERLRDGIGEIDEVYSSPLGRAMDTAGILGGRPPVEVPGLGEVDLTGWNGDEWPEVEAAHLGDGDLKDGAGAGQPHGGETWSEVQRRVSPFLESLVRNHSHRRVAVVSHGGVIRACAGSVLDFGFEKARLLASLDNASVTQVVMGASGNAVLATYNITAHLEN
ncbi:MAG: histidine phosphatase family protein [bacterium]|nr:histidine phosphatase family protein [bacterium]MDE0288466.1 histidine phosphatase family protein [bacterium]MDE0439331.1 histidine phosphatase family protein [bacterium]